MAYEIHVAHSSTIRVLTHTDPAHVVSALSHIEPSLDFTDARILALKGQEE